MKTGIHREPITYTDEERAVIREAALAAWQRISRRATMTGHRRVARRTVVDTVMRDYLVHEELRAMKQRDLFVKTMCDPELRAVVARAFRDQTYELYF